MKADAQAAVTPEGVTSAARRAVPGWAGWAVAVAAYAAIGLHFFAVAPFTHCSSVIHGGPGDATGGYIWINWNLDRQGWGPFTAITHLAGWPAGAPLFQPQFVTLSALLVPFFALTKVVGAVCAWNLELFAGLLASAVAMYAFVRWLTGRWSVAFLAGYAFAFNPFHLVKMEGHLTYVHTWGFPLALWAMLALWRDPRRWRAVVVGAVVGLAGYIDGYYVLMMPVFAASVLAVWVLLGAPSRPELVRRAGLAAVAALSALVLLAPVGVTLALGQDSVNAAVERTRADVARYSARPWDYVLPSRWHPVFRGLVGAWQDRHLHGSNYSEQSLYLGATVLVAATGFVIVALGRRRRAPPGWRVGIPARHLALALGVAAVVAVVFSGPPTIPLLGRRVPTPSGIVFDVAPYWRSVARFFVVVSTAVVTLGALGLSWLTAGRRRQWAVVAVGLPLLAFDLWGAPPGRTWSFEQTPAVYRWLARQPATTVIAEYPLVEDLARPDHQLYQTFQLVHGLAMLNGAPRSSRQGELAAGLIGPADPQTVPVLRRLGVGLVVVHEQAFPVARGEPPAGLVEVGRWTDPRFGETRVYRVSEGAAATAALGVGEGFYAPEADGWSSRRWMADAGTLVVRRFVPGGPVCAGFSASSIGGPRRLTVTQGHRVLWSGPVAAETDVAFEVPGPGPVRLVASPGVARVSDLVAGSTDTRLVTVSLSRLWATAPGGSCTDPAVRPS